MEKEMANFDWYNPVKIVFGKNRIPELSSLIPKDKKVLILYGGGSAKRFGTIDRIKEALAECEIGEFGGIEANPTYETCIEAVQKVKEENYNFLLAVGGGSVIDGTKFIAAAALFEGDPYDIFGGNIGKGTSIKEALPIGTILTLPATSSEMNASAVISFEEKKAKVTFSHPSIFPQFSILEPELTYTLPKRQLANGVSDVFIHIIEQYLTYPVGGMVQDRFAESLLQILLEIGPQIVDEKNKDYTIRANFMWTASLALSEILSRGVPGDWTTHALGHEVTSLNQTDHARTLTAILPTLLEEQRAEKREKLIQYAERVFHIEEGTDDEKVTQAIQKTVVFFKNLDMPVRLGEVGVQKEDIDYLIAQLDAHGKISPNRPNRTVEFVRKIYEKAL